MSEYRRPNPRSNWRRPKPKIYDCNKRDLENLYQSSYGEYLSNKADIEARRLDREQRGDAEALARRFEQRRAASLSYGDDEQPRRFFGNRDLPNGASNHTESSFRTNTSSNDDGGRSFVRSSTSSSRQVSFNTSLNDADEETTGESRLARLRRLRQELGLPAEAGAADSSLTSKHSSTFETSRSSRRRSPSESRSGETSRYRSERTTRTENVTRASPSRNGYERKTYSSHTEGSTQNGLDDSAKSYSYRSKAAGSSELDDSSKTYSYRSKAAENSELDDMASFEASVASRRKARKAVEKPSLDGIDLEYDDEALLADMRKKLPSSSEILERIKNMDMD